MFLLDTNIISALAPTKANDPGALLLWLKTRHEALYLSTITATEVHLGIAKATRTGATTKAAKLLHWWQGVELAYGERILPFDLEIAALAGRIGDHARAFNPEFADVAIAATARVRGLTVLTCNLRHFEPLGVKALDPTP